MEMSLHRVIAEIKNLEQKLVRQEQIVATVQKKDRMAGSQTAEQFEQDSQGKVDAFVANLERLRKLKVARNLANATNSITVSGEVMTIDEAIARKATAGYAQQFVYSIQSQLVNAANQVALASAEVERKIEGQVSAIGGSTKKVSDEELKTIRTMIERSTGREIVMGKNVESFVKKMSEELEKFMVEVDFALSEANASVKVEV